MTNDEGNRQAVVATTEVSSSHRPTRLGADADMANCAATVRLMMVARGSRPMSRRWILLFWFLGAVALLTVGYIISGAGMHSRHG